MNNTPEYKALLKKVRRIQITARRVVAELLSGEYRSVFKGRGMEFDEVREYQTGDEMRMIDWNVTARMGRPFVKRFIEEREQRLFFLVDLSASGKLGTTGKTKNEVAAEICALLAFSAIENNDRVGLIAFTDQVELFIPPEKGVSHVLYMIREILAFRPQGRGTCISCALEHLGKMVKKQCVAFLISDFQDNDYEKALQLAALHYDLIAIRLADPCELALPSVGLVELEDPETGERISVDTSSSLVRQRFAATAQKRMKKQELLFGRVDMDWIDLRTDRDYVPDLVRFFQARERRQLL
jgi:uncharacterized protein (DUF58 family)